MDTTLRQSSKRRSHVAPMMKMSTRLLMLVNCVAYQRGAKLSDIPVSEIRAHLGRPECFVWVALKDADAAELAALQDEFGLHELAIEDAQKGHQRPKIDEYGSSLFVVMHLIELGGADLQTGEVAIFVGPQYVVSVRRDAQTGFCRGAPPLRAGARAAAARTGLRALRTDGHGRRSLLPDARRAHRRDRRNRETHLRRADDARADRGALFA